MRLALALVACFCSERSGLRGRGVDARNFVGSRREAQGRRADGAKKEGAPKDTGAEGYIEMPGGEDGQAKWKALEITTAPRYITIVSTGPISVEHRRVRRVR